MTKEAFDDDGLLVVINVAVMAGDGSERGTVCVPLGAIGDGMLAALVRELAIRAAATPPPPAWVTSPTVENDDTHANPEREWGA